MRSESQSGNGALARASTNLPLPLEVHQRHLLILGRRRLSFVSVFEFPISSQSECTFVSDMYVGMDPDSLGREQLDLAPSSSFPSNISLTPCLLSILFAISPPSSLGLLVPGAAAFNF